jgi:hypothetical protein
MVKQSLHDRAQAEVGELVFLLILAISYLTRPANRQCQAIATPMSSSHRV